MHAVYVWPSTCTHKPTIHRKMLIFSTGQNSILDSSHRLCIYVIDGIYFLLCTLWQSLVHKLCKCSSKTKRLNSRLLRNGVRIWNWKRTFLEMYLFNCITPSYNLRTISCTGKKVVISKSSLKQWCKKQDFDVMQWTVGLCIDDHKKWTCLYEFQISNSYTKATRFLS